MMSTLRRMLLCVVCLPAVTLAAPCVFGPLSTYVGFSCSHFGIDFDVWTYDPGGSSVAAADIFVTPSVVNPIFEFTTGVGWTAPIGGVVTPVIGFHGTGTGGVGMAMFFLAFGTGDGTITLTMDNCLNSTLPGCVAGTLSSFIHAYSSLPLPGPFYLALGASSSIDGRLVINVDASDVETLTVNSVEAGYLVGAPEPGSVVLASLGLMALGLALRLRPSAP